MPSLLCQCAIASSIDPPLRPARTAAPPRSALQRRRPTRCARRSDGHHPIPPSRRNDERDFPTVAGHWTAAFAGCVDHHQGRRAARMPLTAATSLLQHERQTHACDAAGALSAPDGAVRNDAVCARGSGASALRAAPRAGAGVAHSIGAPIAAVLRLVAVRAMALVPTDPARVGTTSASRGASSIERIGVSSLAAKPVGQEAWAPRAVAGFAAHRASAIVEAGDGSPSGFTGEHPGRAARPSNRLRCKGSTASTLVACSSRLASCQQPRPKNPNVVNRLRSPPCRRDSGQRASGGAGAGQVPRMGPGPVVTASLSDLARGAVVSIPAMPDISAKARFDEAASALLAVARSTELLARCGTD